MTLSVGQVEAHGVAGRDLRESGVRSVTQLERRSGGRVVVDQDQRRGRHRRRGRIATCARRSGEPRYRPSDGAWKDRRDIPMPPRTPPPGRRCSRVEASACSSAAHSAIASKPIVPACANSAVAYGQVSEPRNKPNVPSSAVSASNRARSSAKNATPPSAASSPTEPAVAIHSETRHAGERSGSTPSSLLQPDGERKRRQRRHAPSPAPSRCSSGRRSAPCRRCSLVIVVDPAACCLRTMAWSSAMRTPWFQPSL